MEFSPGSSTASISLLDKFCREVPLQERSDAEIEIALIYLSTRDLSDPANQAIGIEDVGQLLEEAAKRGIALPDGTTATMCLPEQQSSANRVIHLSDNVLFDAAS